ncbi:MAG: cysteine desulfurase [Endomicrobium sp.]|jgi:cysteine desulfurase|nr:cysteine desulfurase [Endomicrobium sp.]
MDKKNVYLDNQTSTKLDDRVFNSMKPFFLENYFNPQSVYFLANHSRLALELARSQVAKLINADKQEIIFTSCGSEANNLAIKGIANALKYKGKHIIVSSIEHSSVLNSSKKLIAEGFEISYLKVNSKGEVITEQLISLLRKDTILVSIQYANPEIGTIQNIKKLASVVKNNNINNNFVAFHTDAVSACSSVQINVKDLNIDALTISSSIIHGPKGAAALYLKDKVPIVSQIDGGIQENYKRAGTENIPAIVGFGKACEIINNESFKNNVFIKNLRDKLITGILTKLKHVSLNGSIKNRLVGNVNFSVNFIEGESLVLFLDNYGIMISSGSACSNKNLKISTVLDAIGINNFLGQGTITFNLSKFNTENDINYVLEKLPYIVQKLRNISPVYSKFLNENKQEMI